MPFELNVLDDAARSLETRDSVVAPPACACPLCGNLAYDGPGDGPVAFQPPTDGTAGNGLPIFNWDQVAGQLTRNNASWSGSLGQAAVVTYAFRADPPSTMPSDTSGFSVFTAMQIQFTEAILALWADVANITFIRVGSGSEGPGAYSNNASMLFGNYSAGAEGASAFAYYPSPGATGPTFFHGDVWINYSLTNNANLSWGGFGAHTIAHEIGHAIGLAHPADYDSLSGEPVTYPESSAYYQDSRAFTVMSYFGSAGVGHSLNGFAFGPQLHDIAAIQLLYGANMNTRTGDTVYGFNSNTGLLHYTITGSSLSPVFSIWDAGGNDTIDFSGYATNTEIDLREEAFSSAGPGNGGGGVAIGNISIARGAVIENAIGGSGNDRIIGNDVANVLNGAAGEDYISGGGGADTMYGGLDNDRFEMGAGDTVDGEAGTDYVEINRSGETAAMSLNMLQSMTLLAGTSFWGGTIRNVERFHFQSGSGNDVLTIGAIVGESWWYAGEGVDQLILDWSLSSADHILQGPYAREGANVINLFSVDSFYVLGGSGEERIDGGSYADTIYGGGGADFLYGNGGGDYIDGGAANDYLDGGAGADQMFGGEGADTIAGSILEADQIDGGAGRDQVVLAHSLDVAGISLSASQMSTADGVLLASGAHIRNVEIFDLTTGSGNDEVFADHNNYGSVWRGGGGIDRLTINLSALNTGVVTLYDTITSRFFVGWSGGGDETRSVLSYFVEALTITGGTVSDTLRGYTGNDALYGGGGADYLEGAGGNDILDGGSDADQMYGGQGDDTYYVDNNLDFLSENVGAGTDTVQSSLTRQLGANFENLVLTGSSLINGLGNSLNNVITGNSAVNWLYGYDGNDTLDGGGDADKLFGGLGDDTYVVDNNFDFLVENVGEGTDTVVSSLTRQLGANFENLTLSGSSLINGLGNSLNNVVTGNSAVNWLYGYDGNDTLDGGGDADKLFGGTGDDTYYVDNNLDFIVENASEGTDTVVSTLTRQLVANFENLVLAGSSAINGLGNSANNTITGNSAVNWLYGYDGADILDGGGDADKMFGGTGDDIYFVDNNLDFIVENASEGTDSVISTLTRQLTANFENLVLAGSNAINGLGNSVDNVITGNSNVNWLYGYDGNDTLDGGGDADKMFGGTGNDTYIIDNNLDFISENVGEGIDTVRSSLTRGLGANFENLVLTGSNAINGFGNTLDNRITGNVAANTLIGDAGADTFVFATALGTIDTITDFNVADDTIELSTAIFTGIGFGALAANAFVIGSAAADADDRIIYNAATGALYYDADGDGGGAAVQIATLATGLALTENDFLGGP